MQKIKNIQDIELIEPLKIDEEFNKDEDENFDLEEISINGYVEVINGDNEIKANNKMVQSILAWYANMTSINYVHDNVPSGAAWYISTSSWNMYLGTDTTNPTLYNTNVLKSPIGTAPGIPGSLSAVTTNPSNGVFNIIFTGTWGAGTVSGTVGEMALYLSILSSLQGFGWVKNFSTSVSEAPAQLVSRLAVADGAFSPFTIITTNPLTINWTYQLSFS